MLYSVLRQVFIAEDDERKQEFRCQVVREQLFRSTSNDVTQATARCNVDYQFLPCAPPLPPDAGTATLLSLLLASLHLTTLARCRNHHMIQRQLSTAMLLSLPIVQLLLPTMLLSLLRDAASEQRLA